MVRDSDRCSVGFRLRVSVPKEYIIIYEKNIFMGRLSYSRKVREVYSYVRVRLCQSVTSEARIHAEEWQVR